MKYKLESDGVTQGLLLSWMECRQKAEYVCDRWVQARPAMQTFGYGNIMHDIVAQVHLLPEAPDEDELDGVVQQVLAKYGDLYLHRAKAKDVELFEIMGINAERVAQAYVEQWHTDWTDKDWVETEMTFRVKVDGIWIRGKIDDILRKGKQWWVFETKTRSTITDKTVRQLQMEFQSQVYSLAIQQIRNKRPAGVLYNVVRNPGLKVGKGGLGGFAERLSADINSRPEWYFRRFAIVTPKAESEAFLVQFKRILNDYRKWCHGDLQTWRNYGACFSGWFACPYLDFCVSGSRVGYRRRAKIFEELEDS